MKVKSIVGFAAIVLASTFTVPALAAEDATMHEVYLAAEAGKFNEAQAMMDKVLHDHPNSAKAHYVEAELLAKQGRLDSAADELNTAERLKPGLPFAKTQSLQNLKAQIASGHASKKPAVHQNYPSSNNNGTPWSLIFIMLGLIAFIYLVAKWFTSRNPLLMPANGYLAANSTNAQPYGSPQPYGNPAPMMQQNSGSGIGSGIIGGLATGAALGAGMVAGEALVHHFIDGDHNSGNGLFNEAHANSVSDIPDDMGGMDFGVADNSSWDDSSGGNDDWT